MAGLVVLLVCILVVVLAAGLGFGLWLHRKIAAGRAELAAELATEPAVRGPESGIYRGSTGSYSHVSGNGLRGIRLVEPDPSSRALALLDVGPDQTVVVFDYRRYDVGTVGFGRAAAERSADVVLFTDPYLSPLSAAATVLLTSSVAGPPPFVSLTAATALAEALALGVIEAAGDSAVRERLAEFDTPSSAQ